jgi:ferredoxin-thioredoxin reductase catalytic subunit
MFKLGETCKLLAERAGAKIITGQEVTKEFAEAYKPDAIIIAAGSSPQRWISDKHEQSRTICAALSATSDRRCRCTGSL